MTQHLEFKQPLHRGKDLFKLRRVKCANSVPVWLVMRFLMGAMLLSGTSLILPGLKWTQFNSYPISLMSDCEIILHCVSGETSPLVHCLLVNYWGLWHSCLFSLFWVLCISWWSFWLYSNVTVNQLNVLTLLQPRSSPEMQQSSVLIEEQEISIQLLSQDCMDWFFLARVTWP